ncbi:MAG: VOC family protein [Burkholderiales bacterium]|nr:VOC family protein [Burkholderiales bacterium]
MQQTSIDSVNHVGIAVRDLAEATRIFEAMGFQLTPYSPHSGAFKPGEPVRPLDSGNRCLMFGSTYLEILASERADKPAARIEAFLARHQGAHIVCFNAASLAGIDERFARVGLKTSGVIPLQREIDTPDGVRTAKFERVQFAPEDSPEGYVQVARHLTPQYIYQPRYAAHPNGCDGLVDTIVVADDLAHFVQKYAHYLDAQAVLDDGAWRFDFPLIGRLTLIAARDARRRLPGTLMPPIPCVAAVSFRVPDLAAQRARLVAAGFTVREAGVRLLVPAEEAAGLIVLFES